MQNIRRVHLRIVHDYRTSVVSHDHNYRGYIVVIHVSSCGLWVVMLIMHIYQLNNPCARDKNMQLVKHMQLVKLVKLVQLVLQCTYKSTIYFTSYDIPA